MTTAIDDLAGQNFSRNYSSLTSRERVQLALSGKPVDRLPCCDAIWPETRARWIKEGHIRADEDMVDHFGFDIIRGGGIDSIADLDYVPELLEEDEESALIRDGNGAILRRFKEGSSTPEHVDYAVKNRDDWEKLIKPHLLKPDRRRIPWETYRQERRNAEKKNLYHTIGGLAPFEQMHPVCGHENLLMGMALDPDWARDMAETYVDMTITHFEILFHEEGLPDAAWLSEDLGFKGKPFISPKMYEELLQSSHQRLFNYLHDLGLKVIVHSCGYIEPLVPGLIKAGMDCLQALEVKAGMDMPKLFENFGQKISFCGNIDAKVLLENNIEKLERELRKKITPVLRGGGGYILHSDHSIPPQVDYETFKYFISEGVKPEFYYQ